METLYKKEPLTRAIEAIVLAGGSNAEEARLVAENLLRQHAPLAVALDRDQNVGAVPGLDPLSPDNVLSFGVTCAIQI